MCVLFFVLIACLSVGFVIQSYFDDYPCRITNISSSFKKYWFV